MCTFLPYGVSDSGISSSSSTFDLLMLASLGFRAQCCVVGGCKTLGISLLYLVTGLSLTLDPKARSISAMILIV